MLRKILPCLIIFITVLLLYYPAIFTYFSQDDFFHFKVSQTDGSLRQFVNLFTFHPFFEKGIAFYRPIFREAIFNIFYSLFGLNPYPFRIVQFLLLFLNSLLAYHLIYKFFKNKYLSFFVAFFYAICSAQVSPLYYLAGGIQALGTTTFLLLTLILILNNSFFAFITFLLALGSHELTSIIPFLISALLFIQYPFSKALKNVWKVLPFFLVLLIYLYLEITRIGFSASEKQYQTVLSLKTTLNSYIWYTGWALGLPEMLIDFVLPGFKLNPNLMRYWGSYYYIIFSTFLISLLLLSTGSIYLIMKRNKLFFDKKFLFFVFWFVFSLAPVILLPLHKSTQYLETGLVAFWTIIGLIILNIYRLKTLRIFCIVLIISLFTLSATSAILQRTTYWAAERGRYAKQLIKQLTAVYPVLPKGAIVYFKNDPNYPSLTHEWGSSSKQAALILNNADALRLIYKDPTIKVYYEDLEKPDYSENNIYPLVAKWE
ncbi:hypothetical protein A3H40_02590 [Candidatus Daviesbacteria bacterium RIFCSPLOWO2_02_FULL_38_15]|uniref:Glycosyltransferase RgtA/B/C/D-like domain-containing protein n=1 Tax=Candidatus Daviesbacteria bacterium RIFCSPLOWO2_02_FULL_38_15 TaxID=1797794 RepID=A0A1F5N3M4_9BACT|nr:MAG: hypothetical protein A3H40_02590 [Candidatus Daviesbacteria bacterium RIFCSPLOWO2_02_FULL_38_15]